MNDRIQHLIAKGNTYGALQKLLEILREQKSDLYKEAIIISNYYENFERKRISGIISEAEERLIQSQINYSILQLAKFDKENSVLGLKVKTLSKSNKVNKIGIVFMGIALLFLSYRLNIVIKQSNKYERELMRKNI